MAIGAAAPSAPQWPPSHTTLTDNLTVSFPAHSSPRLSADGVECKIKQWTFMAVNYLRCLRRMYGQQQKEVVEERSRDHMFSSSGSFGTSLALAGSTVVIYLIEA